MTLKMKINRKFSILIFSLVFIAVIFYLGMLKVVGEKTKIALSHATALCHSINTYYEKNGSLPESSENLLQVVLENSNGNDVYTKDFFEKGESTLKYNKLSPHKYEFIYEENNFLFKVPKLFCDSNREQKDKKIGGACDCLVTEY